MPILRNNVIFMSFKVSIFDALTQVKIEKIQGDEYINDF